MTISDAHFPDRRMPLPPLASERLRDMWANYHNYRPDEIAAEVAVHYERADAHLRQAKTMLEDALDYLNQTRDKEKVA